MSHDYSSVVFRNGTEYSNIQKSAEYWNSKDIFDYSIYGGKFHMTEKILPQTVKKMSR